MLGGFFLCAGARVGKNGVSARKARVLVALPPLSPPLLFSDSRARERWNWGSGHMYASTRTPGV